MEAIQRERPAPRIETPEVRSSRRPAWTRWALAAVLVLAVIGFCALGLHHDLSWDYLRPQLDVLQGEVRQHLLPALLLFIVYGVVAALSLLAGALFGRWRGTGLVSLAATLGGTRAFLISRYRLRDWVRRRFGDRLTPMNQGVERDGSYYLLLLWLIPVFPFFLIDLGMSLTPMRAWTFAWVSFLGMLPGTFLYVNAGVLVSLALLAVHWFVRRRVTLGTAVLAPGVLLLLATARAVVWPGSRLCGRPTGVRSQANSGIPSQPSGGQLFRAEHSVQ